MRLKTDICSKNLRVSSSGLLVSGLKRLPSSTLTYRPHQRLSVQGSSGLPPELEGARRTRQLGLTASSLLVGSALVSLAFRRASLPDLSGGAWPTIGAVSAACLAAFAVVASQEKGKDRLMIEVRSAGSKGNGAFAAQDIAKGTYLGEYDGELIDERTYWQRYPGGVAGEELLLNYGKTYWTGRENQILD